MKAILDFIEFRIYKPRWLVLVTILFIGILFHSPLEDWVTKKVVDPYLSKVPHSFLLDSILWLLLILITLIAINRLLRNYLVGQFNLVVYFIVLFTYLYYRNFAEVWDFLRFKGNSLCYTDVLAFPFLFAIVIRVFNTHWMREKVSKIIADFSKNSNISEITPFILDEPLSANGNDELDRRNKAEELVAKLLATKSEKSIAIGINGEWGSGKTSFFQMMRDELSKCSSAITIDFNPWRGYKEHALYQDFFSALSEEVGKHGDVLKMDLKRYGDTLTSTKESVLDSVVSFGTNLFNVNSIEDQHKEINIILKKLNKTFIIFVDDLDRLSASEIADIIKLVRNTADFYNIKFILAYDRNYLLSALKKLSDYNYETYLEKVILYEYSLIPISDSHLKQSLQNLFSKYIVQAGQEQFKKITAVGNFERGTHILNFVFNLRDVKRLCNKMIPLYNIRHKEVEAVDFVNFELLRFRFPAIARLILNKRSNFMQVSNEGIMTLHTMGDKKDEFALINHIDSNLEYYQIEQANKDSIYNLLRALFVPDRLFESMISDKSIRRFKNFDVYFRESESESDISHEAFENLLLQPLDEIKKSLHVLVKAKKRWAVVNKFTNFKPQKSCQNTNEFEKIIRAIFFLGNIPAAEGEEMHGYPDKDILDKLDNTKTIIDKFYGGKRELYHNFIINILESSEFPYFNESGFLNYLSDHNFYEGFILSQEEIEQHLIRFFKQYCERQKEFDRTFWRLYRNCVKRIRVDDSHTRLVALEEAKQIHIDFSFKSSEILLTYLRNITGKDIRNEAVFRISDVIYEIYGDYQVFADKLAASSYASLDFVKEFLDFHKAFKGTDYKFYVPFQFQYLFKNTDEMFAA